MIWFLLKQKQEWDLAHDLLRSFLFITSSAVAIISFLKKRRERDVDHHIWFVLHWCSAVVLRFIYTALITPLDSPFYSCKMMMLNCALINCQRKYILLFKRIGIKKEHVKNFRSSLRPKIYWKQRTLLKVKSKAISTHINVKFDLNWMQGGMSWMVFAWEYYRPCNT